MQTSLLIRPEVNTHTQHTPKGKKKETKKHTCDREEQNPLRTNQPRKKRQTEGRRNTHKRALTETKDGKDGERENAALSRWGTECAPQDAGRARAGTKEESREKRTAKGEKQEERAGRALSLDLSTEKERALRGWTHGRDWRRRRHQHHRRPSRRRPAGRRRAAAGTPGRTPRGGGGAGADGGARPAPPPSAPRPPRAPRAAAAGGPPR